MEQYRICGLHTSLTILPLHQYWISPVRFQQPRPFPCSKASCSVRSSMHCPVLSVVGATGEDTVHWHWGYRQIPWLHCEMLVRIVYIKEYERLMQCNLSDQTTPLLRPYTSITQCSYSIPVKIPTPPLETTPLLRPYTSITQCPNSIPLRYLPLPIETTPLLRPYTSITQCSYSIPTSPLLKPLSSGPWPQ